VGVIDVATMTARRSAAVAQVIALALMALALAACSGTEPAPEGGRVTLEFEVRREPIWESGSIPVREDETGIVEVPDVEEMGGFPLEVEFRTLEVTGDRARLLFRPAYERRWPPEERAIVVGVGAGRVVTGIEIDGRPLVVRARAPYPEESP